MHWIIQLDMSSKLLHLDNFARAILSQFTEEQMSRYESFRRAGFQKANMKRVCFFFDYCSPFLLLLFKRKKKGLYLLDRILSIGQVLHTVTLELE